jgi:hypothetical protein
VNLFIGPVAFLVVNGTVCNESTKKGAGIQYQRNKTVLI